MVNILSRLILLPVAALVIHPLLHVALWCRQAYDCKRLGLGLGQSVEKPRRYYGELSPWGSPKAKTEGPQAPRVLAAELFE